jgi:hypothetical protein
VQFLWEPYPLFRKKWSKKVEKVKYSTEGFWLHLFSKGGKSGFLILA